MNNDRNVLAPALSLVVRVAAAMGVSYCLFIMIPALHALFGVSILDGKTHADRRALIAEMIQKPKEQKKQVQQRIRRVTTSSGQNRGGEQTSLRFSPDLGLEAGAGGDGVALQGQELAAEVFEEGQTDEPAVPLNKGPLAFPERAREVGAQGVFEAYYVVNHEGRVVSFTVLKSPHSSFNTEWRRAVMAWRFKPARNKGIPVNMRFKLIVDVKLE